MEFINSNKKLQYKNLRITIMMLCYEIKINAVFNEITILLLQIITILQ